MTDSPFTCVLDVRASLGECPLWSIAERALYWVDINAPSLNRFDPGTGLNAVMPMPASIGSFAFRAQGGFVVAASGSPIRSETSSARLPTHRTVPHIIASTMVAATPTDASSSDP